MSPTIIFLFCLQAFLINNVFGQYIPGPGCGAAIIPPAPGVAPGLAGVGLGAGLAGAGLAPGFAAPSLAPGFPAAAPYVNALARDAYAAEAIGAYGGSGVGDVAVAGEIPVAGNTLVAGQVPVLGSVRFAGDLPAFGKVSISGSCGCGNAYPYY